jgi:DNA replicative helicase MCM subunit Mcm2 (Cdc46/Mcm family)
LWYRYLGARLRLNFKELQERQRFLQKQVRKEQLIDRKIELLSIINQLTAGPRNIVQREHIIIEASMQGFTEKEVDELIDQLTKEEIIYVSSPGYIKKR